ncbi:MAG TPA: phenylalanine--tRNA ligase subunit beta [Paraburkholderia sp.]|uniref:phenylalanine--tRNA ligase subunit beta n=1 Tax=Paraburkholderia sp. TaxID=1926495 RepID=UPI002B483D5F|nr:phenylalanine--tRNA ligase subunit beta [Paraburkholderia sp.]HKR39345.1 phenylalanine--tRNA ligase subunit beta [Paraburkholderia sp.]
MKFSENWLRSLVDIRADSATLARRLTMSGLEVAEVASIGHSLDDVVVARIVACAPHPDADKLRVCRVDAGTGDVQIVCGAPNAREGLLAPLAKVGAKLPNGITIETAKLRGIESQGMLCSGKELGVDADASGLMELPADAPIGEPLADYLRLPDTAIEVELTPNRGDCLGMLGLADEVAAEFGSRAQPFEPSRVPAAISAPREIRLEAGADCPRYLGRALRGIDMTARTPAWMAQRLRAAGVKPINAVVDVTNYVMLETGQPLHAFDEAKLYGAIVVRHARDGETLKLLDESDARLDPSFLLIADEIKPLAVAGVMGGFDSRVSDATRDVFLESAHFAPSAIMGRARKLGLATDAAHRFERGVDPELPRGAIERATALLMEIAGGQPGEVSEAATPAHLRQPVTVLLRRARIPRVLGIAIDDAEVERILTALGMQVEERGDGWLVTPPSRRFDIEREEDLIEEVARIHGYDAIPARLPAGVPPAPHDDESVLPVSALTAGLAARDYHEAICYAFVDPKLLQSWRLDAGAVPLANPLSAEMAVMRTSLLPGLVDALKRNRNRQQTRVRLFETGVVFARQGAGSWEQGKAKTGDGGAPVETGMLAVVACGGARAEQWGEPKRTLDFFDIKGDLEALSSLSGSAATWAFDAQDLPAWLHPGRGARVLRDGEAVGAVGALHPLLQRQLDLPETWVFEVRSEALRQRNIVAAKPLPHFPSIRRDIAVELDDAVEWAAVALAIRAELPTMLQELVLFDCFRGPGLGPGRKSLAIGLILQDSSRTLTDQDADRCVADAVARLESEFGAGLRR